MISKEDVPALSPKIVDELLGIIDASAAGQRDPGVVCVPVKREIDLRVHHQVHAWNAVLGRHKPEGRIGAGFLKSHRAAGHLSGTVQGHHLAEFEFAQKFSELFNVTSNHKVLRSFLHLYCLELRCRAEPAIDRFQGIRSA